jgi:hypothetical protein
MGFSEILSQDINQRRLMYLTVTILACIPLLTPIGLPVPINSWTMEAYDKIDSLEPGSKVVVSACIQIPAWPEIEGSTIAMLNHLFSKEGIKIVIVSFYADGPMAITLALKNIDTHGKEYGVDWVHLPFLSGAETALAGFASDIKEMTKEDFFGTPLTELPLMDDINTLEDFDFAQLFMVGMSPGIEEHLRQWILPYGIETGAAAVGIALPWVQHYYAEGFTKGYVASVRGGAEYERLIKMPGKATAMTESLSATHVFLIILIIAGNAKYFYDRSKGE